MIPKAVASGNCEMRPESTVMRVETTTPAAPLACCTSMPSGAEHRQPRGP
jgi:hypothetical protein